MSWSTVGVSVEGAGHRQRGGGCQDAHRVERTESGFALAVADGAGSARLGGLGARLAVDTVTELLVSATAPDPAMLAAALGLARSALEQEAAWRGVPLGDMATTIHTVVLFDGLLMTAQIGDGAVVVRDARETEGAGAGGAAVRTLDPVERGEYLNETVFLTSSAWVNEVRFGEHDATAIDAVAVLTDGLQLLAFDLAAGLPHAGFFEPIWRWASTVDDTAGEAELAAFLGSERVRGRTDDDTTLVLAVRG